MYLNISRWVDEHRQDILGLNKSLVSIPSENRYPNGDEKTVQEFVFQFLSQLGCEMDMFLPTDVPGLTSHAAYLGERNYENRPNVVARKRGNGQGRSLLFSGHMDTVPKGDDPWTVHPYAGVVKDGKQYGLGIFDMKGGMAAAMMALRLIEELNISLKGDVLIETVVDEEYGGANGTLACRLRGYEADLAIVPEPSNLAICPENQGGSMFRITFKGHPGRAFSGETLVNPVFAAARFLDIFHQFESYHGQKRSTSKWFASVPFLPAYVQGVKAGPVHLPLSDRVPSHCTMDVWIQCYPETTEEELHRDFVSFYEERAQKDDILRHIAPTIEKLIRFLPGTGIPDNHSSLEVLSDVAARVYPEGLPVKGAPFACDSFMFNLYSHTPAIIWGPKGGNAHAPDEYIEIEDFFNLVKMYALTIVEWCGVVE
ncbi:M20/M25/M40 family metallo-hydrolase [Aneurinibacillus tyrosinisolvens]|uniref:M20/M25/M40 family metallo-hydrolase n=1 Tax=Aneurinibacillus tyrosinisolvens TaxID=1443435 RepID=UPI00069A7991|nr:M20/M25/M40 family metallo-hydrolase [Aneurinibacillus tyrosinisolvens]